MKPSGNIQKTPPHRVITASNPSRLVHRVPAAGNLALGPPCTRQRTATRRYSATCTGPFLIKLWKTNAPRT